jgi:hypothetical protein
MSHVCAVSIVYLEHSEFHMSIDNTTNRCTTLEPFLEVSEEAMMKHIFCKIFQQPGGSREHV